MIVLLDWLDDCMFEFTGWLEWLGFGLNGPLNWLDWLGDRTKGFIGLNELIRWWHWC